MQAVCLLVDALDYRVEHEFDAFLLHLGHGVFAQVFVKAAQHQIAAVDLGDFGAHAVEDAGELDRDVAAAADHHPFRELLQVKGFVGGDGVFDAGHIGHVWPAAGRHQDGLRRNPLATDIDRVHIFHRGAGLVDRDPGILQGLAIEPLEPGDLLVLVGDQGLPVKASAVDLPAESGRGFDVFRIVRGIDEELFRDAAPDHAGAAHAILLRDGDLGAERRGDAAGAHAARTAADDKEIVVEIGHGWITRNKSPPGTERQIFKAD